ncbi:AbrB/MazE/SpoVT family DNA-binding domain-containing protein [Hoeflea alexandrii]|jgi:AbrB family looped-hinge helix DNA binding protein|uniref:AbrB/MazE/SpoVT family DNA-binding domain-containing protein n=1 Tax=Hoeflea alexandrii TaxID=288436 RepID=A0ABT1CL17_9HYPH|nr:AbrB/MazE/SpoVT family DNA-binding domain-containing protein [Hoeflea alexandrii]MCO6406867.1 AbrB/MazE/SpoVT family DNA-binding domain-containing protein [Hoeflea alexandrii]MCY0154674.1 AbrB/MazE/SpoVT family DNA-binding domain-containing protein [Hoeflea alexandrii]
MRVSEKGQITIPKHLRERAGIAPNSEVTVDFDGGRLIIAAADRQAEKANRARLERFMQALRKLEGTGDQAINADQLMQITRDR